MYRKRIFCLAAALCLLTGLALPAAAAEVDCDSIYCFSAGDFSEDESLAGICITALPDAGTGTVFLGTRVLQPGDILTADQLGKMTFSPLRSEEDQQAVVTYLPIYADRVEATTVMSIAVIGKTDQAPVAEDSAMETYKNQSLSLRILDLHRHPPAQAGRGGDSGGRQLPLYPQEE